MKTAQEGFGLTTPQRLAQVSLIRDGVGFVALLLLPAFALRALLVSNFELETARALAQFTTASTFASVIFVDISIALAFLVAAILAVQAGRLLARRPALWQIACGALLGAAALLTLPVYFTNPLVIGTGLAFSLTYAVIHGYGLERHRTSPRSDGDARLFTADRWNFLVMVGAVIVLSTVARGMWLAPEALATRSLGPMTVYVLSESATDVIYFEALDPGVLRMPKSNIIYRQFCTYGPEYSEAQFELAASPDPLPRCPGYGG